MKLITKEVQKKLDDNMKLPEEDRQPVVKFFGGGGCNWFFFRWMETFFMAYVT